MLGYLKEYVENSVLESNLERVRAAYFAALDRGVARPAVLLIDTRDEPSRREGEQVYGDAGIEDKLGGPPDNPIRVVAGEESAVAARLVKMWPAELRGEGDPAANRGYFPIVTFERGSRRLVFRLVPQRREPAGPPLGR